MESIKTYIVPTLIVIFIVAYMLFYKAKIDTGFNKLYKQQQEETSQN